MTKGVVLLVLKRPAMKNRSGLGVDEEGHIYRSLLAFAWRGREKPSSIQPTEVQISISPSSAVLVYRESSALDHVATEAGGPLVKPVQQEVQCDESKGVLRRVVVEYPSVNGVLHQRPKNNSQEETRPWRNCAALKMMFSFFLLLFCEEEDEEKEARKKRSSLASVYLLFMYLRAFIMAGPTQLPARVKYGSKGEIRKDQDMSEMEETKKEIGTTDSRKCEEESAGGILLNKPSHRLETVHNDEETTTLTI
uniref:Uncharacterized protein n=1 Tax=Timema tahoe TaxID=61484 RepID=A0A7R9NXT5_9NEOP|nr:unnamed protein product [Timema tahoe]